MNLSELQSKIFLSPHCHDPQTTFPVQPETSRIVFTNGCFDILHAGHISSLLYASNLGDLLIVGLNSDISVRKQKGAGRPVVPQSSRALILASLLFVDFVIIFDEMTPLELLSFLKPHVIVKGSDYTTSDVVKHSDNAYISLSPLIPDLSSSFLLENYIKSSDHNMS